MVEDTSLMFHALGGVSSLQMLQINYSCIGFSTELNIIAFLLCSSH